jgi:hypothetical protein
MNYWIENQEIENALRKKSINELLKVGVLFCLSDSYEYCVVLRRHSAWQVKSQSWRDANEPPSDNSGRWVLNFYKFNPSAQACSWFKLFVPIEFTITSIHTVEDSYHLVSNHKTVIGKFDAFDNLMWDILSGNAETEEEILRKFELLNSSK